MKLHKIHRLIFFLCAFFAGELVSLHEHKHHHKIHIDKGHHMRYNSIKKGVEK